MGFDLERKRKSPFYIISCYLLLVCNFSVHSYWSCRRRSGQSWVGIIGWQRNAGTRRGSFMTGAWCACHFLPPFLALEIQPLWMRMTAKGGGDIMRFAQTFFSLKKQFCVRTYSTSKFHKCPCTMGIFSQALEDHGVFLIPTSYLLKITCNAPLPLPFFSPLFWLRQLMRWMASLGV